MQIIFILEDSSAQYSLKSLVKNQTLHYLSKLRISACCTSLYALSFPLKMQPHDMKSDITGTFAALIFFVDYL